MPRESLAQLLLDPGRVLGTWSQFADPDFIDLIAAAGYRYTIIDGEHGAFGIETIATLVRACEAAAIVPLVRVPRGDHALAAKALDSGAAGIVAPGVESAAEAAAWVAALRFAPAGTRGACPIVRAAGHSLLPWPQVHAAADAPLLIALVETAAGVQAAAEVADVPGLAAMMVGPFDLSVSLGRPGDVTAAPVRQAIEQAVDAAQAAGLRAWMPVFATERVALQAQLSHWSGRGVRHFAVGADKIIAAAALQGYRTWAQGAG